MDEDDILPKSDFWTLDDSLNESPEKWQKPRTWNKLVFLAKTEPNFFPELVTFDRQADSRET